MFATESSRKKGLWFLALIFAVSLILPFRAQVQGGLLDKAKDLLDNVGKSSTPDSSLTSDEIASGLREALKVGTERVVGRLGAQDGFNTDPKIHIPLPENLRKVQSVLKKVGMSKLADDLELRLNRAAETATPKAKALFWAAIREMTLDDVMGIYKGPPDAATQYFRGKTSEPLTKVMRPTIDRSLSEVGAIQSFDTMMGKYRSIPFVPDVKSDLSGYATEKTLSGLFYYLAAEEKAIRENPAQRTTDLLKRVFGAPI